MSIIHHIEINVSDLAASKAFWSWLLEKLGFSKYQEWEQGFSYKEGDAYSSSYRQQNGSWTNPITAAGRD